MMINLFHAIFEMMAALACLYILLQNDESTTSYIYFFFGVTEVVYAVCFLTGQHVLVNMSLLFEHYIVLLIISLEFIRVVKEQRLVHE